MGAPLSSRVHGLVLAGAHPKGHTQFDRLRPRPMLPVAQAPVVSYPLRWLADSAVPNVTVCANSVARGVRALVRSLPDMGLELDFYEDWMPRGPAGCARDAALRVSAERFVAVDGTAIPCMDIAELLQTHESSGADMTLAVHPCTVQGAANAALSPAGVYVFERRALEQVSERGYQDIKETLLPRLNAAGLKVTTHLTPAACPRVLSPETYLAVNKWMVARVAREGRLPEGYNRVGDALVHESVRLGRGARLVGPVMVAPGVKIGDGATLVGATSIGSGCVIEAGVVVSRSVLWNDCQVGAGSLLDFCVVADAAEIEPGSNLHSTLKAGLPSSRRAARAGHAVEESRSPDWADALLPIPAASWRAGAA